MSRAITLSVGVPAYNQGPFLRETLDSLLAQDEAPHEVVVSENHSTDETPEVLREYEGRVRVVRPPEHLSMMANWNFLVSHLRGEWFALLSSDDVALPNYVADLKRGIGRSERAVLVRGGVEKIGPDGTLQKVKHISRIPDVSSPPRTLTEQLYGVKVSFAAFAARKEAWERVGGYPSECQLAGDWGFTMRLAPLGDFVRVPSVVARYRVDHRSEEANRRRISHWAHDYEHLFRHVIPRVVEQLPGVDPAEVAAATRYRCQKELARASRSLPPGERAELAEQLREWATGCGLEAEWERFRRGGRVSKPPRRFGAWGRVLRALRSLRSPAG